MYLLGNLLILALVVPGVRVWAQYGKHDQTRALNVALGVECAHCHAGFNFSQFVTHEMMAAGHYWAARSDMKCARPERVQARAARHTAQSRSPW